MHLSYARLATFSNPPLVLFSLKSTMRERRREREKEIEREGDRERIEKNINQQKDLIRTDVRWNFVRSRVLSKVVVLQKFN